MLNSQSEIPMVPVSRRSVSLCKTAQSALGKAAAKGRTAGAVHFGGAPLELLLPESATRPVLQNGLARKARVAILAKTASLPSGQRARRAAAST